MATDGNLSWPETSNHRSESIDFIANQNLHTLTHFPLGFSIYSIMKQTTTQFDFAAKPKVTAVKPKYREETRLDGVSLMNDPRVVRGNTYAAIVETKNDIQPPPRKAPK